MLGPVALAWCIVMYASMRDFSVSTWLIWIAEVSVIILFSFLYSRALSRISRKGHVIVFECALHHVEIAIDKIRKIRAIKLWPYGQMLFIVTGTEKLLPRVFVATRIGWNYGWMTAAEEEVESYTNAL